MNAKEELLKHIEDREVKYVQIRLFVCHGEYKMIEGSLEHVLPSLNFEDDDTATRLQQGTIWYTDGTWSSRMSKGTPGLYYSYWKHILCPPLPEGVWTYYKWGRII